MGLKDRFGEYFDTTFAIFSSQWPILEFSPSFKLKPATVPLYWYLLLTAIFFTVSVLNNMAYNFEISQPLHMVFRSSSLAVSLFLGFFLFRKSYTKTQVLGVLIVTIGIFVTTYADTKNTAGSDCGVAGCKSLVDRFWDMDFLDLDSRKLIGIGILTSGLFLSSLLGHMQSWGYDHWKKRDQNEAMFYQHFFSIFFFLPFSGSLVESAQAWSEGEMYIYPMTWMWFNVLGNLVTQYICVRGVYLLVSTNGPVTTTMILTVRKFLSLIISITMFGNVWTLNHWMGTVCVFGGALVYALLGGVTQQPPKKSKKE